MKKFHSAIHYMDARSIYLEEENENLSIPDNLKILVAKAVQKYYTRKAQAKALGCCERTLFRYIKNYNL